MVRPAIDALLYTGNEPVAQTAAGRSSMFSAQVNDRIIPRVLIGGFTLVILFLVSGGVVAIRNIASIRTSAAELVREQALSTRLIDEIQWEQENLNAVFYTMGRRLEGVDRQQVLAQLRGSEESIGRIVKTASEHGDIEQWNALWKASQAFTEEARRLLEDTSGKTLSSQDLLRRHEEVIAVVAKLIDQSHGKSRAVRQSIETQASRLMRESLGLLGAGMFLAVICAALTVVMTTRLIRRMEWQSGELSRVSWHMLENQESVARRFSHELHDELGQSLTAIKTNLLALRSQPGKERMDDCIGLVDRAIGNVREMSQLLRPTVLDDFGLDASLRALVEKFSQRTNIEAHYDSNCNRRLADETETHLYRIAQEALTNVARHSGASDVWIDLAENGGRVRLRVRDNGRGLDSPSEATGTGMGMIGMRARARSAGGEFSVSRNNGSGVAVDVWVPLKEPAE